MMAMVPPLTPGISMEPPMIKPLINLVVTVVSAFCDFTQSPFFFSPNSLHACVLKRSRAAKTKKPEESYPPRAQPYFTPRRRICQSPPPEMDRVKMVKNDVNVVSSL
jgi:hypothetical protein